MSRESSALAASDFPASARSRHTPRDPRPWEFPNPSPIPYKGIKISPGPPR
ncbi:hypothetical protein D187_004412 [Cystobacter fuscus DSM 2262]|uniref:Uncharacterized protein n=1 Tax=Cystobacter fuscus (strain ATCC 25194 / DSM 2262 / NBRC 100088 / M29) TaxID=1242864 RepID=S9QNP3_CYSF2|nr:hypothetical protein D187_004412 [Cystobacter fuscus DSM 2262]